MGAGRFLCVALPFILSVGSIIALLIACLGGVTNKDLYMFRVDTREMQLSRDQIQGFVEGAIDVDLPNLSDITGRDLPALDVRQTSDNVTAKQIGLDNLYDVALWGYCQTSSEGNRTCTDPAFDWANKHLNTSWVEAVGTLSGGRIEIPKELTDALNVFKNVAKWTQVAYIISFVSLALAVVTGIFASCTRAMSCVTFLVATVAAIAVTASAAMSTVLSTVVVGTVESSAKIYGVRGNYDTTFLALVWISAACAIGAAFFWIFTICCCAPSKREGKVRYRDTVDGEKLLGAGGNGAYQPLATPAHQGFHNVQPSNQYNNQYGAPPYPAEGRADLAYEPYSHRS